MGGSQSSETHSVSIENPNKIEVTEPVLCRSIEGDVLKQGFETQRATKHEYSAEETNGLTAKLDEHYAEWLKDVEATNEEFAKKVRDELIYRAEDLYHRFSHVESKPVCERAQKDVLRCYEDNKNTSLNCSEEVKYFTDCVRDHQMNYNASQYMPKEHLKRKAL